MGGQSGLSLRRVGDGHGVTQGWACLVTAMPALCSWYFSGISRTQAQQLLLSPANAPGAFLIRPSESSRGDYSLSGTRGSRSRPCPAEARCPAPTGPDALDLGVVAPQCLTQAQPPSGLTAPIGGHLMCLLAASVTHSFTYSLTYSLTHPSTYLSSHPSTCPLTRLSTLHPFTYPLTNPFLRPRVHSCAHILVHLLTSSATTAQTSFTHRVPTLSYRQEPHSQVPTAPLACSCPHPLLQ